MIHPIPSGTRDVLPDEMRELRAITAALHGVFEGAGYGELYTPALEYESVDRMAGGQGVYRMFDESTGEMLALRSDMTVPIARVVGTRYASADVPLRFSYFAHAYRAVRPQRGQPREFLQAGIELVGSPAPQGTAEALTVLCRGLDAVGLRDYRIGVGDASLFPALLAALDVPEETRARMLRELVERDYVGLEHEASALGVRDEVLRVAQLRGGPAVLDAPAGPVADACEGLRAVHGLLEPDVASRVIFDLGLVRDLDYYTGAVFEVYDPALGAPIGGGGRYDDLLGKFGRPLPAVGFALGIDRLHIALAGEERRRIPTCASRCRAAPCSARRSTCSTSSASTRVRCAPTIASCCSTPGRSSRCARRMCPPTWRQARRTSGSRARTCFSSSRSATCTNWSISATGAASWCWPRSRAMTPPRRRCGAWA
jgi:ATP phosphoribosyltransferase regulatory subunit